MKKTLRKLGRAKTVILGLVFVLVGCFITYWMAGSAKETKDYPTTEATIVFIDKTYDYTTENYDYTVYIDYSVGGTDYTNVEFPQYKSSYKYGAQITIKYNPDDPSTIYATDMGPGIFIGLGLAAFGLAFVVVPLVKGSKSRKIDKQIDNNEYDTLLIDMCNRTDSLLNTYSKTADESEFTFSSDTFNQKHFVLKDSDGTAIIEAVRTKNAVVVSEYDFINNITKQTVHHKVGATVTNDKHSIYSRSYFKLDGEEIWEYLRKNGVELVFTGFSFVIKYKGQQVGKGTIGTMQLKAIGIKTSTKYLDIVFLCCFAAARCPVGVMNY